LPMITALILNPKTYISRPDLEALYVKPRKFLTGYDLPPENESRSNVLFSERTRDTGPKKGGISIGQEEAHGIRARDILLD